MPKGFQNRSKWKLTVKVQNELCSVVVGEESKEKCVDSSWICTVTLQIGILVSIKNNQPALVRDQIYTYLWMTQKGKIECLLWIVHELSVSAGKLLITPLILILGLALGAVAVVVGKNNINEWVWFCSDFSVWL